MFGDGFGANLLSGIALDVQYQALGKGLVDSRNVIYLLSLIVFFIFLTLWRVESLRK